MKRAPLSFVGFRVGQGEITRFADSVRLKASAKQSDVRMSSRRRPGKWLSSALSILASLAVAIFLSGTLDSALAADDPTAVPRNTQVDPLDVPGSFKDLPNATDAVTAKRLPEQIRIPAASEAASVQLTIDVEKSAAAGRAVYLEGDLVDFDATAYCLKGRTASGIDTRPGVIAADPRVLPIGTVVHLRAGRYTGTYTVMDTGGRIRGRRVDVYVPTHREAMEFGRRQVKLKVIGRGSGKAGRASKNLVASGF
jgi:3D (Asp-Asp-Asp) domain-containing protein